MSLRCCICSWNVNILPPNKESNLFPWLDLYSDEEPADIYAIGLQEVPYDPQSLLMDYYIRNDPWSQQLLAFLRCHGIIMVEKIRMVGLLLIIAVKTKHLPFVRDKRTSYVRTALWGLLGSKGAVAARIELYGESFCFVNAHLAAGDQYQVYRNQQYNTIMSKIFFPSCKTPSVTDHRFVFFFGDLNYRLDDLDIDVVKEYVNQKEVSVLLTYDQLLRNKKEGKCFDGFEEGTINFAPTYKYDLGTDTFDTSEKKRKPAWCDRILWREKSANHACVKLEEYTSNDSFKISDHKPIRAHFQIDCKSVLDAIPVVTFSLDPEHDPWRTEEDAVCVFYVNGYQTSSWDWIGLFKTDFAHSTDYYTYEWSLSGADPTGKDGCMILFDDIPEEPGSYQIGYYSKKLNTFLGFTEPFEVGEIILQPEEQGGEMETLVPTDDASQKV